MNCIVLEFISIPLGQNGSRQNNMVQKRNPFSSYIHSMRWSRQKATWALIPKTSYCFGNYSYINHTSLSLTQGKEETHEKLLLRISAITHSFLLVSRPPRQTLAPGKLFVHPPSPPSYRQDNFQNSPL